MRKIILSMITISMVTMADMYRNDDGTVTDTATNLMWQDDYSDNEYYIKEAKWISAISYCENLNLGGYDDWRLPNIRELTSIIDDITYDPAIDISVFQNTVSDNYWSSTTYAGYHKSAWVVKLFEWFPEHLPLRLLQRQGFFDSFCSLCARSKIVFIPLDSED